MTDTFMKQQPQDLAGNVCSAGSENKTFHITTTTGWDAVTLPTEVECKDVLIKVRSSADATALTEDAMTFLFSSESDGTGSFPCVGGIGLGVGKMEGILGYVYTGVADLKIAVLVVA